jgi:hypothetical protein
MSEMDRLFVLGDIELVRQLNHWKPTQASGIEVLVDDLRHLEVAADAVYFATANRLDEAGNAFYTQTLEQLNPQIFGWLDFAGYERGDHHFVDVVRIGFQYHHGTHHIDFGECHVDWYA